ncbi:MULTISPECIES: ricin-type beta-trefoil lectin domain protein [unclassified Nonomuraea]|uniref:RICIN domain-containing protein n=1 Tax=unclassified Nonomuraea TaxID=2593643 RepID=UPI0033F11369
MRHLRRIGYALGAALALGLIPATAHAATPVHVKEAEQSKCLDIRTEDDIFVPGARLQRFTCHSVNEQQWEILPLAGDAFLLRNPLTRMCVAAESAGFGAQVVERACGESDPAVRWFTLGGVPFVKGSGFNQIRSALASGSCLDTLDTFVKIFPCSPGLTNKAQLWAAV